MFRARQDNSHKALCDRDLYCDHQGCAGCAAGADPSSGSRGWVVVSNESYDLGDRELNVIKGRKMGSKKKRRSQNTETMGLSS